MFCIAAGYITGSSTYEHLKSFNIVYGIRIPEVEALYHHVYVLSQSVIHFYFYL